MNNAAELILRDTAAQVQMKGAREKVAEVHFAPDLLTELHRDGMSAVFVTWYNAPTAQGHLGHAFGGVRIKRDEELANNTIKLIYYDNPDFDTIELPRR